MFMIFLVYCIVSLFYDMFVWYQALRDIFHTPVARYSLFVLKASLNASKPDQTMTGTVLEQHTAVPLCYVATRRWC